MSCKFQVPGRKTEKSGTWNSKENYEKRIFWQKNISGGDDWNVCRFVNHGGASDERIVSAGRAAGS
jgi:hypothetical protein